MSHRQRGGEGGEEREGRCSGEGSMKGVNRREGKRRRDREDGGAGREKRRREKEGQRQ